MEPAPVADLIGTGSKRAPDVVPVAFVSSHARHGGSERYLALLLEHLDPACISTVVCLEDGPLVDELRSAALPVEVIPTGRRRRDVLAASRRLRRTLRAADSAVVHANGIKAASASLLATAGTRVPVLWLKHDVSRDGWQARLIGRRCARIVGVSAFSTAVFRGRARRKVEVLYTQIPRPTVDWIQARRAVLDLFAPDKPKTVVSIVGRLDPFKGHADLFSVAPAVLAAAPGTKFLIVGGEDPSHPGTGAAIRQAAVERGIEYAVRFTGYRADAVTLICGSDLLLIAGGANDHSRGIESFPLVGLEALAVGTPVVAYAHGGLPEQLGDCGVLVPPGDRDALAEILIDLASDPIARERVAWCGQERFQARFELSTLTRDLSDRYRLLLPR